MKPDGHNRYIKSIPSKRSKIHIFPFSVHGTFSKIDHMLGFKTCLIKCKKTETVSSIVSSHNGKKVEINYKKTGKKNSTEMWRLN